jgi:hypothetical protein
MADLRSLMWSALGTSSDAEMIGVLQVGREEMPEAVKTLQRALERVVEREGDLGVSVVGGVSVSAGDVVEVDGGRGGRGVVGLGRMVTVGEYRIWGERERGERELGKRGWTSTRYARS